MCSNKKWTDASRKDLTFAVLMSANKGSVSISANWDEVENTMESWGYSFTRSALRQYWNKIVREFRDSHAANDPGSGGPATPSARHTNSRATSPTPQTPASAKKGKKRDADRCDGEDTCRSPSQNESPISNNKTPRSTSNKRARYTESPVEEEKANEADKQVDCEWFV